MRSFLRFLLWSALIIGVILGALRLVAIRWLVLPTNDPVFETSIMPSLKGGDLIVVTRIIKPRFGDLVLCPDPNYPTKPILGRIVGEPGDTVRIEGGNPIVGNREFQLESNCDPTHFSYPNPDNEAEEITQSCDWEAISNHLHMVGTIKGHTAVREMKGVTVTEGKFFLVSDNRLYPYDSRDYGLVDIDSCKETVLGRIMSKDGWMDSDNRMDYIP